MFWIFLRRHTLSFRILCLERAAAYLPACSPLTPRFSSSPLLLSLLLFFFYYFRTEIKLRINQSALAPQLLPYRSQVLYSPTHSTSVFILQCLHDLTNFFFSPSTTVPTVMSAREHSPILPPHTQSFSPDSRSLLPLPAHSFEPSIGAPIPVSTIDACVLRVVAKPQPHAVHACSIVTFALCLWAR